MLHTENLTKKYAAKYALDNVSINVPSKSIYGFIGRNGAGKTTSFRIIMKLASATHGSISTIDYQKIGFMIGTTFDNSLSAKQNLKYCCLLKNIKNANAEVDRVLQLVDLAGIKKPFKSFSMGMKQRLGIASALLGNPEIVILDEPLNGLDPQGVLAMRNLIKKINEEQGTTFIISSHILSELDLVATHFGIIEKGKLVQEITREELHKTSRGEKFIKLKLTDENVRRLEENALEYEIENNDITLEEYYFKLIGGGQ
jgi:ABC-2 type transport system ATP-binding protein